MASVHQHQHLSVQNPSRAIGTKGCGQLVVQVTVRQLVVQDTVRQLVVQNDRMFVQLPFYCS